MNKSTSRIAPSCVTAQIHQDIQPGSLVALKHIGEITTREEQSKNSVRLPRYRSQ